MFALTSALIAGGIALTWLLNPLGATRSRFIDSIFRKIKRERVATPYLLRITQPQTLLLGSSRVLMGMRIEQGERNGVMNAALTGATFEQISQIVDVALRNPQLKRIIQRRKQTDIGIGNSDHSVRRHAAGAAVDARRVRSAPGVSGISP